MNVLIYVGFALVVLGAVVSTRPLRTRVPRSVWALISAGGLTLTVVGIWTSDDNTVWSIVLTVVAVPVILATIAIPVRERLLNNAR
ncbi:hypothetical protein EGT67_12760 [Prescottella agglutinans]|uniref:Uncharacterized protein n=1 Tax=Prescottella agglutinans TaxID=1644129 RepID=A0A3S3EAC9_9NOCA|nr:hypothetical protein [Prescottella agglutinans]RVW09029.1 hypothetical protein EGT67_12760 [Prescottella agglutinans]